MAIEGYDDRKRKEGWTWDRVSTALDLSIAAAAFSAQISMYLSCIQGDAVDHWRRALDIIEAGQSKWSDVKEYNKNFWFAPHMVRAVRYGLLDSMISSFGTNAAPEVIEMYPQAIQLAGEIIEDALNEASAPESYPSLTDYAAFRTEHLVTTYCDRGNVYSKLAVMVMCGAVITGPVPPPKGTILTTWWSPFYTRRTACDYIAGAAFRADDDPECSNYLFIAISNMCHTGHVSIRDVKAVYEIALTSMNAARPLFGDDGIHQDVEERARKLIQQLDSLVDSGKATLNSLLHPFPDPEGSGDTKMDEIVPTVFVQDENEVNWRTPDGMFVEFNPIFSEARRPAGTMAWYGGRKKAASMETQLGGQDDKWERKNGHDDWQDTSYLECYLKARRIYEIMKTGAEEGVA
ncbi:hypothetical protein FRB95_004293 [Tulasnella sp. JGI-2019a]|nr:hypothetical protein FRB95_004293 [Tulasnella sp. JGI-2019a]